MDSAIHTVIIGAGPYGLSLAAHLQTRGVPFRIFGRPMQTWSTQMPRGMKLKSDGFASNLYPGRASWTLEDFCRETGRAYHPTQHPVALDDFIAYGQEFARRFVPSLEAHDVTLVESLPSGRLSTPESLGSAGAPGNLRDRFRLLLDNDETVLAANVVLAVGLAPFPFFPAALRNLPPGAASHTADHVTFDEFCGRDVTVLGRGASALNAAALLHESGASVTLISRREKLHIHQAARSQGRPLLQRLRHPSSPLGPSLRSWLATHLPLLFHALPAALRRGLVYKHLGPAGGSSLRGRVQGKLPILLGYTVLHAERLAGNPENPGSPETSPRIELTLLNQAGEERTHVTSHIVAGTGFQVDVQHLRFLAPALLGALKLERGGAPTLDSHFGSSVPGLYFVGPAAAACFGPLLRFAAGSRFTSARLSAHLGKAFARGRGRRAKAAERSLAQAPVREGQTA